MKSRHVLRWTLGVAGLAVAAVLVNLKTIDRDYLSEALKDRFSAVYWKEDWSGLGKLTGRPDYHWLDRTEPSMLRIAHALGGAGTTAANTMAAFSRSTQQGFIHQEVDLWLDKHGRIRCHHGPQEPAQSSSECELDELAATAAAQGTWLILDIKTSFEQTGSRALQVLQEHSATRYAIFQLYAPSHLQIFNRWAGQYQLPGPIVTAYLAHRSLNHVASFTASANVRVLTVPLDRAAALSERPNGLVVMVHPVHTCGEWETARRLNMAGVYMLSGLRCE